MPTISRRPFLSSRLRLLRKVQPFLALTVLIALSKTPSPPENFARRLSSPQAKSAHALSFDASAADVENSAPISSLLRDERALSNYLHHSATSQSSLNSTFLPLPHRSLPHFFRQYLVWHAHHVLCIRNAMCFAAARKTGQIRLLVWACPGNAAMGCSGTSNRFRGIVSALALAVLTRRVLLVEWPRNPFPITHVLSPAVIDWRVPVHVATALGLDVDVANRDGGEAMQMNEMGEELGVLDHHILLRKIVWAKCPARFTCNYDDALRSHPGHTGLVTAAKSVTVNTTQSNETWPGVMDAVDDILVGVLSNAKVALVVIRSRVNFVKAVLSRPEWRLMSRRNQTETDDQEQWTSALKVKRYMLRSLFMPSPVTSAVLRTVAPSGRYVAVHARTGEDVGEAKWGRFHSMRGTRSRDGGDYAIVARMLRCAQEVGVRLRAVGTDNGEDRQRRGVVDVFVASDSLALKRAFLKRNGTGARVFCQMVKAAHVAHEVRVDGERKELRDLVKDPGWMEFVGTFVELFTMAGASTIVATRSGFSRVAFLMSDAAMMTTVDMSRSGV